MKITLIIPTYLNGGMERVMSELGNFWAKQGHVINIIFLVKNVPFYTIEEKINRFEMPNFSYKKNGLSKFVYSLRLLFYVRKKIIKSKPDLILSFGEGYNSFVLLSALGYNVYVSDRSNPLAPLSWSLRVCRNFLYPTAKGVIAQTSFAKEVLLKQTKHKNIIILPNPIKIIEKKPLEKKSIILNVGRLVFEKDQVTLIEIFSKVAHMGWELHIVGEGPLRGLLEDKIDKLKLKGSVKLLGSQKDLSKYFSRSKIFAFTSISEGYPNALCEAMAFPLACISFDCDAGPRDIIDNGVNGFLIKKGDINEFTERLLELMYSDKLQNTFKSQSIKIVDEQTIYKIAERILKSARHENIG